MARFIWLKFIFVIQMICFQVRVAVQQVCVRTLFGASSFSIAAPKTRNSLRPALRVCSRPDTLRRRIKTHYFQQAFHSAERRLYAIASPSVVCLSSVTLVRPTQAAQIFDNISTALGTLAIRWHPLKISQRSSQGNPSAVGVKHKMGSQV